MLAYVGGVSCMVGAVVCNVGGGVSGCVGSVNMYAHCSFVHINSVLILCFISSVSERILSSAIILMLKLVEIAS